MTSWRAELVERVARRLCQLDGADPEAWAGYLDDANAAADILIPAILERAAAIATRHAEDADRVVSQSREGACRTSVMGESIAGRAIATAILSLRDSPDVEA